MEEAALALTQNSSKSMICRVPRSKARRERRRLMTNQVAEVHFSLALLAFRLDSRTTGNTRVTGGAKIYPFRASAPRTKSACSTAHGRGKIFYMNAGKPQCVASEAAQTDPGPRRR